MAPLDSRSEFAGPFTRMGVASRPRDITDGLSSTIFFGEVRPMCSQHAQNGWAATNNGNGYCTTLIPINYDSCQDSSTDNCKRPCNWTTEVGFKSRHSGGAQFLLGDGSVHMFVANIDFQVYQYLGEERRARRFAPLRKRWQGRPVCKARNAVGPPDSTG